MNEIQIWLRSRQKDWEEGIRLFRKYSKHQGLYKTFINRMKMRATQEKLIYELRKLSMTPGIEKPSSIHSPVRTTIVPPVKPNEETFFPPRIEKAIKERSTYANKRDKLRRELLQAQDASPEERKNIMIQIRDAHALVMNLHSFIKEFEKTGIVPVKSPVDVQKEVEPSQSTLTEAEKEEYEKQWKSWMRKRSKNKSFLKDWREKNGHPKQDAKIKYYTDLLEESENQCAKLAELLGKTGLMKKK